MIRKLIIIISLLLLVGVSGWWLWSRQKATRPTPITDSQAQHTDPEPTKPVGFEKSKYSKDDPDSIWVVVNKLRPLDPIDHTPTDLIFPDLPLRVPGHETMRVRQEAANALARMFAAAKKDSILLMVSSGHRSYSYQKNLYDGYVASNGQAAADSFSARPGHSEHQTGLAVDVEPTSRKCELMECFGDLPEGKWVTSNAHLYGFIIRYTQDNQAVAGYSYEPWHLRYVGVELAVEMNKQKITTLEAFFDLPPAPDYQ